MADTQATQSLANIIIRRIERAQMKRKRRTVTTFATSRRRRARRALVSVGEMKFFDTDVDDAVIATPSTIVTPSINLIPDGSLDTERIGRKSVIRQIHFRYNITLITGTLPAETSDTVVVIVYLDKQANGAAATATTILEQDDFQGFLRIENKDRIKILMRKTHSLSAPSAGGNTSTNTWGEKTIHSEWNKTGMNIKIQFSGSTGAIAEIKSNNIGILLLSNEGFCKFEGAIRIRFTDN